jgi:hypothetical protein
MSLTGGSALSLRRLAGSGRLRPTSRGLPCTCLPRRGLPRCLPDCLPCGGWLLRLVRRTRRTLRPSSNPTPTGHSHRENRGTHQQAAKAAPDVRHRFLVLSTHNSTLPVFRKRNRSIPARTSTDTFRTPPIPLFDVSLFEIRDPSAWNCSGKRICLPCLQIFSLFGQDLAKKSDMHEIATSWI